VAEGKDYEQDFLKKINFFILKRHIFFEFLCKGV
jgi:hypothetical protein